MTKKLQMMICNEAGNCKKKGCPHFRKHEKRGGCNTLGCRDEITPQPFKPHAKCIPYVEPSPQEEIDKLSVELSANHSKMVAPQPDPSPTECSNCGHKAHGQDNKCLEVLYEDEFGSKQYCQCVGFTAPEPSPEMPLIKPKTKAADNGGVEVSGEELYDEGFADGMIAQRDADMAWHKKKIRQVRKAVIEEIE